MFVHKIIQSIFLTSCVLLLSSCGGGGSSSTSNGNSAGSGLATGEPVPFSLNTTPDGVNSAYQGKKTPVQLTTEQSTVLLKTLFAFSLPDIDLEGNTASGKAAKSLAKPVKITQYGQESGTYRLTGDMTNSGGVLTAVWKNYSDTEGALMNGKAVFNIVQITAEGKFIKSTTRYVGMNIINKQQDVLINGYTIEQYDDSNGYTTTIYDASIQDKKNGKWLALDKLKERKNGRSQSLNGRLYRSDLGYIDIATQQELYLCLDCDPAHPVGGKMRFSDSQANTANFTFLPGNDSKPNKIDLAYSKAGQNAPETKQLDWRDFPIWVNENRLPRIAQLNDPPFYFDNYKKNYLDSLTLKFSAGDKYFDDDGDNVTLSYVWYVNGNQIATNHTDTLSVPSFKAGDDIKLDITADDGYHKITQTVTAQKIRDTRSVISIKPLPEIIVGQEFTLDASDTYDVDDGELSYQWTIGTPQYNWVQVNEAVINNRNKKQTKAHFIESGRFELTLNVTQQKAQGEPAVTSKSIILQPKNDTQRFFPAKYLSHPLSQDYFLSVDDITGDGKANILLTFKDKKEIAILNKVNRYEPIVIKLGKQVVANPLVKDINADGRKDILALHENGVSLLRQNLQGDFVTTYMEIGIFNKAMISGDFNHDGSLDIAVVTRPPAMSLVLSLQKAVGSEGGFEFYPGVSKRLAKTNSYYDSEDPHLTVTDINQDGIDDILLWANSEFDIRDKGVLMLSNFSITDLNADSEILVPPDYVLNFKQVDFKLPEAGNQEQINDIVFADIDNNGDKEIIEVHSRENSPYFYRYTKEAGQFNAQNREKYALSDFAKKIAVADIDGDGEDDMYYFDSTSVIENFALTYVLSNNGKPGSIRQRIKLQSSPLPDYAAIGDLNGDGKNDIVIAYPDKFGFVYAK